MHKVVATHFKKRTYAQTRAVYPESYSQKRNPPLHIHPLTKPKEVILNDYISYLHHTLKRPAPNDLDSHHHRGNTEFFEVLPSWHHTHYLEQTNPFGFLIGHDSWINDIPKYCSQYVHHLETMYQHFLELKQRCHGEVRLGSFNPEELLPDTPPLLLLYGTTGRGKTSLFNAIESEIKKRTDRLIQDERYEPLTVVLKIKENDSYPVLETVAKAKKLTGNTSDPEEDENALKTCFKNVTAYIQSCPYTLLCGLLNSFLCLYLLGFIARLNQEMDMAKGSLYCTFDDLGYVSSETANDASLSSEIIQSHVLAEGLKIFGAEAAFMIFFYLIRHIRKESHYPKTLLLDPCLEPPPRVEGSLSLTQLIGEQRQDRDIPIQDRYRPSLAAQSLGHVLHFENLNALDRNVLETLSAMVTNRSFELAENPGWAMPFFPFICSSTNTISEIPSSLLDRAINIHIDEPIPYQGPKTLVHLFSLIKYLIEKEGLLPLDITATQAYLGHILQEDGELQLNRFTCEQLFIKSSHLAKAQNRPYITEQDIEKAWQTHYHRQDTLSWDTQS